MKSLQRIAPSIRVGRLGRNAAYGSAGLGIRAAIQAGYLVLLSRWMGAQGYGLFAGSVAVVSLVAPFSGWGITYVLSRRIARDRASSRALWASAMGQVVFTGAVMTAAIVAAASLLLKERIDILSMVLIGLAEMVVLPLAQAGTSLCFAVGRGLPAAFAICLVPAGRLFTGMVFMAMGAGRTPALVATSHFLGSLVGIVGTILLIAGVDGWPAWRGRLRLRETLREGAPFAAGALVGTSYQEVDKVLMLQLLGAAVVGPYTAAFRVVSVFALPVSALMSAALPRLFATHGGPEGSRMLRHVVWASIAYGLLATLVAAGVAPLMPHIFGEGFGAATRYLLLLSPWPILFALHQATATGLTAFGRQHARVGIEALGLLLVVALNALLLRPLGAGASVLALLATEAFMALGCSLVLRRK
ncbi:MAG TPA: oligosaccharide flippase family protein [Xanthomonadaceae bacterium]